MLFPENMMHYFKKKSKFTPREDLLEILNTTTLHEAKATQNFLIADASIVRNTEVFDKINQSREFFHEEIAKTKHGKVWFKSTFEKYLIHLKRIKSFEGELVNLDAYLSLYWFLSRHYPIFMESVVAKCQTEMDPRIRRYYEKTYNIDVFTGQIFDYEVELSNVWKEHFYKASFAFHEGKGNIEISLQEWRTFLKDFVQHLSERPRLVYDFAKEIVAYQKLFQFLSYVVRMEGMKRKAILGRDENSSVDELIRKIINAVYAVDETHGIILKRLYV